MLSFLIEQIKRSRQLQGIVGFFLLLSVWWVSIYVRGLTAGTENDLFILIYPILPLVGGYYGLIAAKKWGGFKSKLGTTISMFAWGFMFQFIGQMLYVYYQLYLHVDIPYPSIGDLFYFGSVVLYVVAAYQLAQVSGIKLTLKSIKGILLAGIIPLVILIGSYMILLQGYEADWSNKLVIFLDFGYPIGQAIYLSIALLVLLISKNILGGLMRRPVMLLLAGLIGQFIADFVFSYQVSRAVTTFYAAGTNDYMFACAYFLMALALVTMGNMYYKVQET